MAGDAARRSGATTSATCETYWSRFGRDVYFTGDGAKRDADGYFWLLGRVDDVINVSGHRISTTEIERALVGAPRVAEAAVIGAQDADQGRVDRALRDPARTASSRPTTLRQELREHVATRDRQDRAAEACCCSPTDLPKTRSGKIMRRLLKDIAEGREHRRHDDAARPEIVQSIKEQADQQLGR